MGKSFHRNKFEDNEAEIERQKAKQLNFQEKRLRKLAEKQAEINAQRPDGGVIEQQNER